jgi:hypothetical protein
MKSKYPKSLKEMPLKDYQKILSIIEENKEDERTANNKIVQYFTGLSMREVNKLSLTVYDSILKGLLDCLNETAPFEAVFEHKGVTYGFIPKLEDILVEESLDAESYMVDPADWHKMMAVLYRPITTIQRDGFLRKGKVIKYDIENYETSSKYADIMAEVSTDKVVGSMVFFWTLRSQLMNILNTSSK